MAASPSKSRSLWSQATRGKHEMTVVSKPYREESNPSKRVGRSMNHVERLVCTLKSRILREFPSDIFEILRHCRPDLLHNYSTLPRYSQV
ncbi:hypothetical protein R1flu_001725 [Riccia fluitans]|uniref:Uncharacterized protein n=1 Tax=Riccia fluitans TaxID=41844 RepID=A0ABD1Y479_9MARC